MKKTLIMGACKLEPFKLENKSYLTLNNWTDLEPSLQVGFTTRKGGSSEVPYDSLNLGLHVPDHIQNVIENRKLLAGKIDQKMDTWVTGEQIHGTNIAIVEHTHKGKGAFSYSDSLSEIDGLITNQKDILCTAFFADCVPLFFFDYETGYIGIAHAGWKGTVNGIGEKMVKKLVQLGANKKTLRVAVGPCISQDAYEVDEKVIGKLTAKQISDTVQKKSGNKYMLDLKKLNVEILLQTGIIHHNIEITNHCTFREEDLFFSHRRDNGKTGRMLGFIGFRS